VGEPAENILERVVSARYRRGPIDFVDVAKLKHITVISVLIYET
jgi:hypothetical protein